MNAPLSAAMSMRVLWEISQTVLYNGLRSSGISSICWRIQEGYSGWVMWYYDNTKKLLWDANEGGMFEWKKQSVQPSTVHARYDFISSTLITRTYKTIIFNMKINSDVPLIFVTTIYHLMQWRLLAHHRASIWVENIHLFSTTSKYLNGAISSNKFVF